MRIKLNIPLTLSEIADAMCGKIFFSNTDIITYISTDSRELQRGDLFIAIRGKQYNGDNFIKEAAKIGAYIVSAYQSSLCCIIVSDTTTALLKLAEYYLKRIKPLEIIAITGSVGKTTTKELCHALLEYKFKIHSTPMNYNNEYGVAFTALSCPINTDIIIFETGMNNSGELEIISNCIHPTLSVITNIGTAHIGNLGSRENIAKAKLEIISGMKRGLVLLPKEEPLFPLISNSLTVSIQSSNADYSLLENKGKNINSYVFCGKRILDLNLSLPYFASHIRNCMIFALAVCEITGFSKKDLSNALSRLSPTLSRSRILKLKGLTIIDDSYNSSYEAVMCALKTLLSLPAESHSVLLGDINELGIYTEEIHYNIGKICAKSNLKNIFIIGKFSQFIANGAIETGYPQEKIFVFYDIKRKKELAELICKKRIHNEALLVKASHTIKLCEVIDYIETIIGYT